MIKFIFKLIEKLTGKRCSRCKYNRAARCHHPRAGMFRKCWHNPFRPGWTGKFQRVEPERPPVPVATIANSEEPKENQPLTPEEEYQLQKIREVLQEASDTARESGLMGE